MFKNSDMTGERNTDELMPTNVASDHVDDALQRVPNELSQIDLSHEPVASAIVSADSGSEPGLLMNSKSGEADAAIGSTPRPEDQDHLANGDTKDGTGNANLEHRMDDKPYSVFTHSEKRIIVLCAGLCAFFSPISGQIYFPSLDAIASDLNVSYSSVNLTITTYLVSSVVRSNSMSTY